MILLRGSAHMAAEFRRVVHPALPLCGIQLAVGTLKPLARHPIYLTMNCRRRSAQHIVQEGAEPLAEELTQTVVAHRLTFPDGEQHHLKGVTREQQKTCAIFWISY